MKGGPLTLPTAARILSVGIGELQITADRGAVLVSYGLGSCVALCLWDASRLVAGMAHVMLPSAPNGSVPSSTPAKFADQAIVAMLREFERLRVDRGRLVAKIAGGAQMFSAAGKPDLLAIGQRNVERIKELLRLCQIPLVAEQTGGSAGRTVTFVPTTGRLLIKTIGSGESEI
jgi:chemotaxis protein CheD